MKGNLPNICKHCDEGSDAEHWYWRKDDRYIAGGCWKPRCLKRLANKRFHARVLADPLRKEKLLDYTSRYYRNKLHIAKYKAYRHRDKVLGRWNDLNTCWAYPLMQQKCFYCGKENALGLDRKDSSMGHFKENVVSCCEFCNMLLSDLPFNAKVALKKGLMQIHQEDLAKGYVIKTKRRKQTGVGQ